MPVLRDVCGCWAQVTGSLHAPDLVDAIDGSILGRLLKLGGSRWQHILQEVLPGWANLSIASALILKFPGPTQKGWQWLAHLELRHPQIMFPIASPLQPSSTSPQLSSSWNRRSQSWRVQTWSGQSPAPCHPTPTGNLRRELISPARLA